MIAENISKLYQLSRRGKILPGWEPPLQIHSRRSPSNVVSNLGTFSGTRCSPGIVPSALAQAVFGPCNGYSGRTCPPALWAHGADAVLRCLCSLWRVVEAPRRVKWRSPQPFLLRSIPGGPVAECKVLMCSSRVLFCRLRLYHGSPRALLHPLLQDPIERKRRGLARPPQHLLIMSLP